MSKCCLFKVLVLFKEYQRISKNIFIIVINKPLQSNDYAIPLDEFKLNKHANKYL